MPKTYERECDYCGEDYKGQGRYYCSMSCRMKDRNAKDNPAKWPTSRAKLAEAATGNTRCLGREISQETRDKIAASLKGQALSPEHRAAISRGVRKAGCRPPRNPHLVGPNHPNWQGGHSTIRQALFDSPEYRAFRKAVLERDNWTCQSCRARGGKLHVHHLKAWGPYPKLRYEVSNGITLCRKCHYGVHRSQPRPVTVGPRILADLYPATQDD